ncbi:hypothetical protein ADILRU_1166 [Leifsonia rubra CMS 76R]|nr:hypothetical protein ADILRU_1166 [Leifsonia rubra CMS 76R]
MAGATHKVDIGDDNALPPWSTIFEIAHAVETDDWVLVGGLMVQLHARRASIAPPRTTKDVDLVADVVTNGSSLSALAGSLGRRGFVATIPDARNAPVYRYSRGKEQVDVMVADHLPSSIRPRLQQRPAFSVDGGTQALKRRDTFIVTSSTGSVTIGVPDVLGALVGKGAAYMVDQRSPQRHLEDSAVLLASIDVVGALDLSLSKNDRRRLNRVASELSDPFHTGWLGLNQAEQNAGQRNLALLISAAALDG